MDAEEICELRRRLVRGQPEPARRQGEALAGGPQVLPGDAGGDGPPGLPFPDDRRGPLRGNPDGLRRTPGLERRPGDVERGTGEGGGVELGDAGGGAEVRQVALVQVSERPVGTDEGGPHRTRADVDDEDAHLVEVLFTAAQCGTPERDGRRAPPMRPRGPLHPESALAQFLPVCAAVVHARLTAPLGRPAAGRSRS